MYGIQCYAFTPLLAPPVRIKKGGVLCGGANIKNNEKQFSTINFAWAGGAPSLGCLRWSVCGPHGLAAEYKSAGQTAAWQPRLNPGINNLLKVPVI